MSNSDINDITEKVSDLLSEFCLNTRSKGEVVESLEIFIKDLKKAQDKIIAYLETCKKSKNLSENHLEILIYDWQFSNLLISNIIEGIEKTKNQYLGKLNLIEEYHNIQKASKNISLKIKEYCDNNSFNRKEGEVLFDRFARLTADQWFQKEIETKFIETTVIEEAEPSGSSVHQPSSSKRSKRS